MARPAGDLAIYFRKKAIELRALADGIATNDGRNAMMRMAEQYDVMADRAEPRIEFWKY